MSGEGRNLLDTAMYSASNAICLCPVTPFASANAPMSFLPQLPSSPLTRTPSRTMHLPAAHWGAQFKAVARRRIMLRGRKQLSCLDTAGTGIQNPKCQGNSSPKEWIEAFAIIIPVFAILIGWAFYQQRRQAQLDKEAAEKRAAGEEV